MTLIIIDPLSTILPRPDFETAKALIETLCECFRLEDEAQMCRWEDDGGVPYDVTTIPDRSRRPSSIRR
jgi:hypothetical protein